MGNAIWTEKYRPRRLENILCNGKEIELLTLLVKSNRPLPHILLYGVEGTGKTTTANAIARQKLGKEWKENTMQLNASTDRGIDVVRNQIEKFGRQKMIGGARFKILILDEYDNATPANQQGLRKTMETFAQNNRFILCCNYVNRVISPIKSRCAIYQLRPLKTDQVYQRLKYIATEEKVNIADKALAAISKAAKGRLRNGINTLAKYAVMTTRIEYKDVANEVNHTGVKTLLKVLLTENNFKQAVTEMIHLFENDGLTETDLIEAVLDLTINSSMSSGLKAKICLACMEVSYQIASGAPPEVQAHGFLAKIYNIGVNLKKKSKKK